MPRPRHRGLESVGIGLLLLSSSAALPHLSSGRRWKWDSRRRRFGSPLTFPWRDTAIAKERPSAGVHDSVGVRVLLVKSSEQTIVLVSCDLLIIDEEFFQAVFKRLDPKPTGIFLAATHTHSGPGGYGSRFLETISMGRYDQEVFDELVTTITRAIREAHHTVFSADLVIREITTKGLVRNRMDPDGAPSSHLLLARFMGRQKEDPTILLVNFAAHPTTLGESNDWISGDYPGVLLREIEGADSSVRGIFFAGAVGDQAPIKVGQGFQPSEWLGRVLARSLPQGLKVPSHHSGACEDQPAERSSCPAPRSA
jgi:neutral ceramidase